MFVKVSSRPTGLVAAVFFAALSGALTPMALAQQTNPAPSDPSNQAIEFADKPDFVVAGVTDWTAVGGHGSDISLRTSEALTQETLNLKSDSHSTTPQEPNVAEGQHLRTLGDLDEKKGDPLAAVHDYERAVRVDPSEENYFAWGSELLLHRAVWQAEEVFKQGSKAFPKSARMLTGLGTALFAGARYDDSAASLCAASDLNPGNPEPYSFMGRIDIVSPNALACVEPRLARFWQEHPTNTQASYFYAMAIWKSHGQDPKALERVEVLLSKAVTLDPKYATAYLQLGILFSSKHNLEKAIGFYRKAIDADPQLGEAHYRLGLAYDRTGAADKAKLEFKLHDEIEKSQAAEVERQRREVKQFSVVLQGTK
jgi:tetratricopeptide (TPR) repeat protein